MKKIIIYRHNTSMIDYHNFLSANEYSCEFTNIELFSLDNSFSLIIIDTASSFMDLTIYEEKIKQYPIPIIVITDNSDVNKWAVKANVDYILTTPMVENNLMFYINKLLSNSINTHYLTSFELESLQNKEIIASLPVGILSFVIDDSIHFEQISNEMSDIIGYSAEELREGFSNNPYFTIYEDDLAYAQKIIKAAAKNHTDVITQYRLVSKNGNIIWASIKVKCIKKGENRYRFLCAFTDITALKKTSEELYKLEQSFRMILESANISVWYYNATTSICHWLHRRSNSYIIQSLGPKDNFYFENIYNLLFKDSIDILKKVITRLEQGEKTINVLLHMKEKNSTSVWKRFFFLNNMVDNKHTGALIYAVDVTDEIIRENIYQNEIAYLDQTQSDLIIDKARINLNRGIVESYTSYYGEDICKVGDDHNEVVNKLLVRCINELDRETIINNLSVENINKILKKGITSFEFTYQRVLHEGKAPVWANFKAKIFLDPVNNEINIALSSYDITYTVELNTIINKIFMSNRYTVILINIADESLKFFEKNDQVFNIENTEGNTYSKKLKNIINRYVIEPEIKHTLEVLSLKNIVKELNKNNLFAYSCSMTIEGKFHRIRFEYTYLDEYKTKIIYVRSDATDRYLENFKQQKDLAAALEKATQASQAKARFLTDMSHNIKTPMNAIINMTTMAHDDLIAKNNEALLDDFINIETSSNLLLELVNDILDITTIDSKDFTLKPEFYEYSDFVNYIEKIFEPLCEKKSITFKWKKGNPKFPIYVDKKRFNQIFFNILSNSVNYTPNGGTIKFSDFIQNGDFYEFTITDTGIGITDEIQKNLFTPFERTNIDSKEALSAGLGLPIAKRIVDRFEGTITIDSKVNAGTKVIVSIPLETPPEKELLTYLESHKNTVKKENLKDKHVLVVEDNSINTIIIKRLLENFGMIVTTARNGKEGYDTFVKNPEYTFNAILMDIRMPIMDGFTASRLIRLTEHADALTIPIIALTADVINAESSDSLNAGMNAHLNKPVEKNTLFRVLSKFIK